MTANPFTPRTHVMNIVEQLLAVLEVIQAYAPEEVAEWFAAGVEEFMAGAHLDDALRLKAEPGSRHAADAYRVWKRNRHIIAAHEHVQAESDWRRSIELERLAREFETTYWPSVRGQKEPPAHWSTLRKELFHAFACGIGIPGKRRIHDIICAARSEGGRTHVLGAHWGYFEAGKTR